MMKILHLMLSCFYIDNYSYQENYLPKYHKKMGHDVEIVASLFTFDENGKGKTLPGACKYNNEYGIPVTRLDYKDRRFRKYIGLEAELERIKPDLIFIHGVQFADISKVVDYCKKNPKTVVYADNHADFSNSATNWVSKNILHKIVWKNCARKINPYVKKFYGVLPARVEFLHNVYGLPKDKIELLVMGADDESVAASAKPCVRESIREKYGLSEDDFVVMTGGKINAFKTQTLLLMEAVKRIDNDKLKLIVFGSVTPELKDKVNELADGKKVQYIGWVKSADSYDYYAAADLVVFPGRHSVFWEQVAGQGIPMLVKKWAGTTHVDLGGNVRFLEKDSAEEIKSELEKLLNNPELYNEMKSVAKTEGMKTFSYLDISRRSIEK